MSIRILLADDQPLVRAGLAMLIEKEPDMTVVGDASDGLQALELARTLNPDIVVMDVQMPEMDGVEATRLIVNSHGTTSEPVPQVIVLTTFNVDDAVHRAIRAGAAGFVLKDAAPDDLAAAIRNVAAGDAWLDPKVARRLLPEFAARPLKEVPTPDQLAALTPREREVLRLVAFGWPNARIAEHLVVGTATVKTHVGRTLMKLGLNDRAAAVAAAYQCGLVKPDEAPPRAG
jgi:DNA-binding NarL/FixJ family response regulator